MCMLWHTDSRLLFQTRLKSVPDKCPKGHIVLVAEKNKTCFGAIWQNPRQFLGNSFMQVHTHTVWSYTYIQGFIQIRSGLGEL